MKRLVSAASVLLAILTASPIFAATFFVPADRDMVRMSDRIVIASALGSYAQRTAAGGIETVTTFSVEEVIKGAPDAAELDVYEPGGALEDRATIIGGVPRFTDGERVLLFLLRTPRGTWSVTNLALGKFTFVADTAGRRLLVRDEGEIIGWDSDGTPHVEAQRSADRFLTFVRDEARGKSGNSDYTVRRLPLVSNSISVNGAIPRKKAVNVFTATSYTLDVQYASGNPNYGTGQGARWNTFPGAQAWYNENTEPGAQNGGVTAIQAAVAAWTNEGGSNVNYIYGGSDSGHTAGLSGADGRNTVQFERNLTGYGAPAFTCSPSSYSGVLGIGGVTNALSGGGANVYNGETFFSTVEGDVEMNQGIANCTLLLTTNVGDWNSALTHEIGHTLGFRHSDQDRRPVGAGACAAPLECAGAAIMHSFVSPGLNANLATWDVHAVEAVYASCSAIGISQQPQASPSSITSGNQSQLTVVATGTGPTYQWYIGSPGNTSTPVGGATSASVMVSPTTTTSYWVRISGSCSSPVDSQGVTVTVSTCTSPGISVQPQATPSTVNSGGTSRLSVTATGSATLAYQWYVGNPTDTSTPVPGGTGNTVDVNPTVTTTYWVRVTNGCGTANSNAVTVTVSASCVPPSFNQQPVASPQTISTGGSSQLSVVMGGTAPFTYQWYVGSPGNTSQAVPSGTSSVISVSPTVTTSYWVRVNNACGSIDSNAATVTFSNGCAPPNVLTQPQDQTVTPGNVTLFVGYTGTSGSVNWYQGAAPDTSHFVGSGQSLQLSVTTTTQFWAQINNSCGSANSRTTTITVTQVCTPPGVTSIAANPTTVAANAQSVLTVVATGTSLQYQWYRGNSGDTSNPIAGATSSTANVNPSATTSYWVRVSNSCGTVDSVKVTVTVSASCTAPTISTQPLSTKILSGQTITLSVIANGTPLTYQWYQGAVDDTSTPIGANSSNVDVRPLLTTSYWVKVTNTCGDAKSNAAVITVTPAKHRAVSH